PPPSLCTPTTPPHPSPLSLHDALPICHGARGARARRRRREPPPHHRLADAARGDPAAGGPAVRHDPARPPAGPGRTAGPPAAGRSEEHTSELQSLAYLVCRLLLEKKKQ